MREPPPILDRHGLVEETLEAFRGEIAGDLAAYRGHVYRVFNLCRALAGTTPDGDDKIAYAAAFHDLGIWSDHTVDYLPPSARRLCERLPRDGRDAWSAELARMIDMHHKLLPYRGEHAALVEPFRRADLIDLSLGLVRFGLPRDYLRELQAAFPAAGFHLRVVRLVGGWALTHPLRPLPMLRI
jgi:hypothetical protein